MAFAKFGREQVRQLDLADLAFNLVVGHARVEIVLETVFAEQLDEKFLRQIRVGRARALFNQESGTARRANERVMRDDAVQVSPQTIDVGSSKAVDPLRILPVPFVAAFSGLRALFACGGAR